MREKKITDYIVEFLISKGVKSIFGYPGGVICHFLDSTTKYKAELSTYINYHEQAAAFAACGYAQECGAPGVAFATSGPGATNLLTGIAQAWFDSLPVLFFTGQVDTYGLRTDVAMRQRGFQETDIAAMASPVTKYCARIDDPLSVPYELEKAWWSITNGRPGPALLDLPADVQRAFCNFDGCTHFIPENTEDTARDAEAVIRNGLAQARRPLVLAGAGIRQSGQTDNFRSFIEACRLPVVTSMPALDLLEYDHPLHMGFIGVNGHQYANSIHEESDTVFVLGSRLDLKQIGKNRGTFLPKAKLFRVDIDDAELRYKANINETAIYTDLRALMPLLGRIRIDFGLRDPEWEDTARKVKQDLKLLDDTGQVHSYLRLLSRNFSEEVHYTLDVGLNQLWAAQALELKPGQRVHMSAGLGSMGYSLPAAIGACCACGKPLVAISGDGGMQMNIQELQFIANKNLPVAVFVVNNFSLGMICGFQKKNFDENYTQTTVSTGYSVPNFEKIAAGYGIPYIDIQHPDDLKKCIWNMEGPIIMELKIS